MKEDSAIYAFVIIVFKMASRSPNFGGKKWHPLFFTKSWSKNNFKPKNQFQQADPTGAQNLTLWPLLLGLGASARKFKLRMIVFLTYSSIICFQV